MIHAGGGMGGGRGGGAGTDGGIKTDDLHELPFLGRCLILQWLGGCSPEHANTPLNLHPSHIRLLATYINKSHHPLAIPAYENPEPFAGPSWPPRTCPLGKRTPFNRVDGTLRTKPLYAHSTNPSPKPPAKPPKQHIPVTRRF